MTKYILHGGYTSEINDLNQGYFSEMVNDVPEGGTILLVYFASREEEVKKEYERDRERLESFAIGKKVSVVKASEENFVEEVRGASVIYIRGGDTKKLKTALDKYPNFIEMIKGKTISGSSAGAYVLSKYYFSNSLGKVMEGYGCVPVRTICHYESEMHSALEDNTDPVTEIDKFDNNLELVLLRDCEWRIFSV